MKPKNPPQIFILEDLIRTGQMGKAQAALREMAKQNIPDEFVRKVASFARRAGLPELGLKLLYPYVRRGSKKQAEGTDAHLAEYAANLVRAGVPREALAILDRLQSLRYPEVDLFRAFAYIGEWRYAAAAIQLHRFLSTQNSQAYSSLVANTNLASCHIYVGEFEKAHALLEQLKQSTRSERLLFLHGKVWKLSAEAFITEGRLAEGKAALHQAERALVRAGTLDKIFIAKWTAFCRLQEKGANAKTLQELAAVRAKATKEKHWETVRDCDRALLQAKPTQALYEQLYFGTPFESFRHSIEQEMKDRFPLPGEYLWHVGKPDKKAAVLFLSPASGELPRGMHTGDTSHRLLLTLCSDFYRPFPTPSLFTQVFPGEFYNPDSSPGRVRMAVMRLKNLLKKAKRPLMIESKDAEYRALPQGKVQVCLAHPYAPPDKVGLLFEKLKSTVGETEFTAKEVADKFETTPRTVQRLLEQAVKEEQIVRIGEGRATRYRWKK